MIVLASTLAKFSEHAIEAHLQNVRRVIRHVKCRAKRFAILFLEFVSLNAGCQKIRTSRNAATANPVPSDRKKAWLSCAVARKAKRNDRIEAAPKSASRIVGRSICMSFKRLKKRQLHSIC